MILSINQRKERPSPNCLRAVTGRMMKRMDFLKKNPFPLAAYCFAGCALLQVFQAGTIVSTLYLLAYIFLAVMLFMKRRDILLVAAAAVPSVVHLLSILIYGTTLLGFLSFVVGLLLPAFVACFLLPQLEPYVGKYMDYLKKYWFVPAAAYLCLWFLNMARNFINFVQMGYIEGFFHSYGFFSLLKTLLVAGGNLLLCNWMVFPEGLPAEWFESKPAAEPVYDAETGTYSAPASELEFNMVTHILLLLFLGAIWQYIWIYRTTKALNNIPGEEDRNPVTKLLLCMFIPFYYLYWVYKSAQRIDKLAASKGVHSDITTLCLILAIFIGIIPPIIMQDKMNAIAAASGRDAGYSAPAREPQPSYSAPAQDFGGNDDGKFKDKDYDSEPVELPAPPARPQLAEPAAPAEPVVTVEPAPAADYAEDSDIDDTKSMKYL